MGGGAEKSADCVEVRGRPGNMCGRDAGSGRGTGQEAVGWVLGEEGEGEWWMRDGGGKEREGNGEERHGGGRMRG